MTNENELEGGVGVRGEYTFIVRNADGSEKSVIKTKNLITNYGLNKLFTELSSDLGGVNYCQLGSGTTEPSFTDLNLTNKLVSKYGAAAVTNYFCSNVAPYYSRTTVKFSFSPGQATGMFTEVGLAATETNTLFSHALIKNGNGDLVTLTVLADEYLDVYYDFYWYYPDTALTVQQTINSVVTNVSVHLYNVLGNIYSNYTFKALRYPGLVRKAFVSVDSKPVDILNTQISNTANVFVDITRETYVENSFERVITATFAPSLDFTAGIKAVLFSYDGYTSGVIMQQGGWMIGYEPAVVKNTEQVFTIRLKLKLTRA